MKKMSATSASKEFGRYLDQVQREPILITKNNRPVAVTISIQDAREYIEFKENRTTSGRQIQKALDQFD